MANMSYCRFENTLRDFTDCLEALNEIDDVKEELSESEYRSAKWLMEKAQEFVEEHSEKFEDANAGTMDWYE